MQSVRQFGNALILAIISLGLVLGGLSISLVEFTPQPAPVSTSILLPSPVPLTATATLPPPLESPTPTQTPTPTETHLPPPLCPIPVNWFPITVQFGDTVESIAALYRITPAELRSANCLLTDSLIPGSTIYVPLVPTITPIICVQGSYGWAKIYTVMPGDTFYHIATNYYTSANVLKQVNCRISDLLHPGEILWVPNIATRTPAPTFVANTPTLYPTQPLTETPLPFTLTPLPTDTLQTPTPTDTPQPPTETPSFTPEPTLTVTPTATQ
jgi:LysM repeat protein